MAPEVEFTLTVPAEIDGMGCDIDIHEVVDRLALDVVLHSVHHVACAHVEDLDVGKVVAPPQARAWAAQGLMVGQVILLFPFCSCGTILPPCSSCSGPQETDFY